MSSVDRDLQTWEILCRRMGERRVSDRFWAGSGSDPEVAIRTKSMTVTRVGVGEKAFDAAQAQEIAKQIIEMADGMDLPPEFHQLLVRLGESLSSVRPATPPPDEGGDQSEQRSGWLNPNSEFAPAFRPGEARRGLRNAATTQAKGRRDPRTPGDLRLQEILLPLEEARAKAGLAAAQAQQKALSAPASQEAREVFDSLGPEIERKKHSRGRAPP